MKNLGNPQRSYLAIPAGVVLLCMVSPTHAASVEGTLQKFFAYSQTTAAAPTAPASYSAYLGAYMLVPGAFDTLTVTYPGPGSPVVLQAGSNFVTSQGFATQAAMDAAYPFGTYTFAASNSVTSATETDSLSYTQDAYPLAIPALDSATFAALQGMNPSLPFTFDFNTFTQSPNANAGGGTYLNISGSGFTSFSSGTAVLPAHTLAYGTTY